jgi:predicted aldo/keto reductase-like oxidoreductase
MIFKDYRGISISRLGMGNMRLPTKNNEPQAPIDREKAHAMIDYAMKSGINYYDSAYVYHGGESEKFLGEALSRYPRGSYYLATKYFIMASADYKSVFEEQLVRLQTDHIDFYLIHGIFDHTWKQYIDCGCIPYLLEQKEKGRIRNLGFSSHANFENFTSFVNYRPWDFTMIQLNCFDWLYGTVKQDYELLVEKGIPVIAMEPVRGGRLNFSPRAEAMLREAQPEWSNAAWALRWVKHLPGVQVVLSGMSTLEQLTENVALFSNDESMSGAEEKLLFDACKTYKEEVSVPCTNCRYCCEPCPAGIDIPKMLDVYNRSKTDGPWALNDLDQVDSKGKPQDCTACGTCNSHCPQGIDISAAMKEMGEHIRNRPGR